MIRPWEENWILTDGDRNDEYESIYVERPIDIALDKTNPLPRHREAIADFTIDGTRRSTPDVWARADLATAAPSLARALAMVEWNSCGYLTDDEECPACEALERKGAVHEPDCVLDLALTSAGLGVAAREAIRKAIKVSDARFHTLIASFPVLAGYKPEDPDCFDINAFVEWSHDPSPGDGKVCAVMFIRWLWNNSSSFDLRSAWRRWDQHQRAAWRAWAAEAWFP